MTKEELEKEAEKNILNLKNNSIKVSGIPFQINEGDYIQGYLDGAEPREKRIAELKAVERMALYSKMSDQLTKAKELLKDFLLMAKVEHLKDRYETVDEAEQFLSEVEK